MREGSNEALVTGGQPVSNGVLRAVVDPRLALTAAPLRVAGGYERYGKPALDRFAGLILCVVAIPIFLFIAAAVRIKLGKGVIYKQRRVGRHGVPFTMYKFRSMAPDRRSEAQPYDGPDRRVCHKRDDDPRHTRFGLLLRKSSLDELPQLWNVIRGEMSLVGPRPELPQVVARYEPWQHERHQVKPGITGFWQLSGRAGGLAYEGVELDIDYLRALSFGTDLVVLLRTVPVAISKTGR
ncbi:MAG TPA: sugar transferase [Acidimicrobiales bacterium]|nr:sugar transferase [Acidimicrobiales bacterium]